LAAVIFGLSPYVAVHMLGHFDLVAAWTIPLFALALDRALRGSNLAACAAGLTLAATAYVAYYHLVYQCFFAAVYLLASSAAVPLLGGSAAVRVHRRASAPSPLVRRLGVALVVIAGLAACVAAAIAVTGGTTLTVGGSEALSATKPQNALAAMWACLGGAL